jgi:hypothetical protein
MISAMCCADENCDAHDQADFYVPIFSRFRTRYANAKADDPWLACHRVVPGSHPALPSCSANLVTPCRRVFSARSGSRGAGRAAGRSRWRIAWCARYWPGPVLPEPEGVPYFFDRRRSIRAANRGGDWPNCDLRPGGGGSLRRRRSRSRTRGRERLLRPFRFRLLSSRASDVFTGHTVNMKYFHIEIDEISPLSVMAVTEPISGAARPPAGPGAVNSIFPQAC